LLVIIDIQECYIDEFQKQKENYERMIAGLRKRVQQARDCREVVISLTHFRYGYTLPEIVELINLTENSYLKVSKIELCGCFRDVCVLETWKGLKRFDYLVTPVKKSLTIATTSNWKELKEYPTGYITGV
jgi:nicotinamidase-related amidase